MTIQTLAAQLDKALWDHRQPIYLALLRGLSANTPVSPSHLAQTLKTDLAAIEAALKRLPDLEYDRSGNVISAGLSLIPTPHRIWFNHQALFAWCALDTLMYPVMLQQTAYVESPCPVTRNLVRLTVTPTQIESLNPAEAVVSIVVPDCSGQTCCTRADFCHQVHFFSSAEAAIQWRRSHGDGSVLSVAEAYQLGQALVQRYAS